VALFASLRGPGRSCERRILLVCIAGFCVLAGIVARLWEVQIVRSAELTQRAQEQYQDRVEILPDRGKILDRHGDMLAVSVERAEVIAYPRWVEGADTIASQLSPLLELPAARIAEKLTSGKGFERLKREASVDVGLAIDRMDLPGIDVAQGKTRIYPAGDCLAAVVGKTNTDHVGIEGIELSYDHLLHGEKGYRYLQKVNRGRSQPNMRWGETPPKAGQSVVLTIDARLQRIVKHELDRTIDAHDAKKGIAVALDPRTGEILAMVASGGKGRNESIGSALNLITGLQFEPGSTFKIVTYGAALEHGLYRRTDWLDAEGGDAHVGNRMVRDVEHLGLVTFDEAFIHSSNVCAAKVGLHLGSERLYRMARAFGFGTRTGVDFPGEISGFLPRPCNFSAPTLATLSFGYEVNVTPLQLACAYAAVANGGILYEPHVVKRIVDEGGKTVREVPARPVRRVLSQDSARVLRELMQGVVAEGTAKDAYVDRWALAGKTGTAKKTRESGRGYDNRYVASFAGFFPAWDPRLVLVVVIDEPREGGYYGGAVAAPAFREMVLRIVNTASIPVVAQTDRLVGPAPKWDAHSGAWNGFLNGRNLEPDSSDERAVDATLAAGASGEAPKPGHAGAAARLASGNLAGADADSALAAALDSLPAGPIVPDVVGMTLRHAVAALTALGHETRVRGTGTVVEQDPPAGTCVEEGSLVLLIATPRRDKEPEMEVTYATTAAAPSRAGVRGRTR
jgi:cell division protein FtsI/penicillin-binding protein 2